MISMEALTLYILDKVVTLRAIFLVVGFIGMVFAVIGYLSYLDHKDNSKYLIRTMNDFRDDTMFKLADMTDHLNDKKVDTKYFNSMIGYINENTKNLSIHLKESIEETHSYGRHVMFWIVIFGLMITIGFLLPNQETAEKMIELMK